MSQAAWQVSNEFATSDCALCPDESHLRDLTRKVNQVKNCRAKMRLLRSCEPQKHLLEDFCSGDDSTFDLVQLPRLWRCKAPLGKTLSWVLWTTIQHTCLRGSTRRTFEGLTEPRILPCLLPIPGQRWWWFSPKPHLTSAELLFILRVTVGGN